MQSLSVLSQTSALFHLRLLFYRLFSFLKIFSVSLRLESPFRSQTDSDNFMKATAKFIHNQRKIFNKRICCRTLSNTKHSGLAVYSP